MKSIIKKEGRIADTYDDRLVEDDYELVPDTYDEPVPYTYDDEPVIDTDTNPIYLPEEMKETFLIEELRKKGIRYVKFNPKKSKIV